MGLDLGGAVNSVSGWVCGAPVARRVFGNPIFVALLLTALVAVILMSLYRKSVREASARLNLRAVLYVFFGIGLVMVAHHYAVQKIAGQTAAQKDIRDVFTSLEQSKQYGGGCGCAERPDNVAGRSDNVAGRPNNAARRTDNVAGRSMAFAGTPASGLEIVDVVLPSTMGPFATSESRSKSAADIESNVVH